MSYILSSKNGKKKEIGASSSLPQYFLFCILGIHGYLTLSICFKLALWWKEMTAESMGFMMHSELYHHESKTEM